MHWDFQFDPNEKKSVTRVVRDAIFAPETSSSAVPCREEIEKVARGRFQDPKPVRRGRFWVLPYWQDEVVNGKCERKRKREKLAPVEMPEREVRKIAAEFLRPLNQGLVNLGSATKFDDYVEEYKASVLAAFAKRTRERYTGIIRVYLSPQFGGLALRDLTPITIQKYFSGLKLSPVTHKPLSHESVDKIRDVLSSILGSAKQYQLLVLNPAENVRLPKATRGKHGKPYLTPSKFQQLIQLISEPYATMIYVAIFTGLRAGELVGPRWRNVHFDSITVDETYSAGEWGSPKSDASNAAIAVNREVIERIERLKTLTVDVRSGNGAVRHSRASTTLDIYQQFVPESQRRAVNLLSALPATEVIQ